MKTSEVFRLAGLTKNYNFLDITDHYWMVELMISDENEHSYSDIDYSDKETRTCYLCGNINNTDELGRLPSQCQNQKCLLLWDYWKLTPFPVPNRANDYQRKQFLKNRMIKFFGDKAKLSTIPKQIIFDFLLTAMIERMAYEQNNRRD